MLTKEEFRDELESVVYQILMREAEYLKTGKSYNYGGSCIDGFEIFESDNDVINWWLPESLQTMRQDAGTSYARLCDKLSKNYANDYWSDVYEEYRKHSLKENPQLAIKDFTLSDYFSVNCEGCYLSKSFIKIEDNIISVGCDGTERAVEDCFIEDNFIYFDPNIDPEILHAILVENLDSLSVIANRSLFDEDEIRKARIYLSIDFDSANRLVPHRKREALMDSDLDQIATVMTAEEFLRVFDRTDMFSETATISYSRVYGDFVNIDATSDGKYGDSCWAFYFKIADLGQFEQLTDYEDSPRFDELIDETFSDSPRIYKERKILIDFIKLAIDAKNGINVIGKTVDTDLDC